MPTHQRPAALRLFALVFVLVGGLAKALGAMLSTAQAAPIWMLKQYRLPTAGSSPEHITRGSEHPRS